MKLQGTVPENHLALSICCCSIYKQEEATDDHREHLNGILFVRVLQRSTIIQWKLLAMFGGFIVRSLYLKLPLSIEIV